MPVFCFRFLKIYNNICYSIFHCFILHDNVQRVFLKTFIEGISLDYSNLLKKVLIMHFLTKTELVFWPKRNAFKCLLYFTEFQRYLTQRIFGVYD